MEQANKTEYTPGEYRTGDTTPPKNYRGIIAFLLVTVILLCGITSALSLMNIRLLQQLQQRDDASVGFSQQAAPQAASERKCTDEPGFTGQSVPAFWQEFYGLPEGVYITQVDPASRAYSAGLRPGDVALCIDAVMVQDMDTLESCLQRNCGRTVTLQLYRGGQLIVVNLDLAEE